MESSAVIYCNSVLGARTNTEGRESTSAAMLTGKIPDWGLHRDEHRYGTHRIDVEVPVDERDGLGHARLLRRRRRAGAHPGARREIQRSPTSSGTSTSARRPPRSGGVEMYHIVGVTPEAESLETAFGPKTPVETFTYGEAERRRIYDALNANGQRSECRLRDARLPARRARADPRGGRLLEGSKVSGNCNLWIFTSRAVKSEARRSSGYTKTHQRRRRRADDRHLLGLRAGVAAGHESRGARFGEAGALPAGDHGHRRRGSASTRDCIDAALTGRWNGERP